MMRSVQLRLVFESVAFWMGNCSLLVVFCSHNSSLESRGLSMHFEERLIKIQPSLLEWLINSTTRSQTRIRQNKLVSETIRSTSYDVSVVEKWKRKRKRKNWISTQRPDGLFSDGVEGWTHSWTRDLFLEAAAFTLTRVELSDWTLQLSTLFEETRT